MYKRHPAGDYHVGVCTNTLCAVLGGDAIFDALKDHLGVGNDETTADGKVTLEHIECNAACDYAPVVMVNWEFFDNQTVESRQGAGRRAARRRRGRARPAARGCARSSEIARVLAGFPDDRAGAVDASGAGRARSLAGLRARPRARGDCPAPPSARVAAPAAGTADVMTAASRLTMQLTPVLSAQLGRAPTRGPSTPTSATTATRRCAPRWRWHPDDADRSWSRTPACAAAAAPASRPA